VCESLRLAHVKHSLVALYSFVELGVPKKGDICVIAFAHPIHMFLCPACLSLYLSCRISVQDT
jgi:hypothetical protein